MSFPGRILSSTNIFKPLQYIAQSIPSSSSSRPSTPQIHYSDADDLDTPPQFEGATLRPWHSRDSSGDLDPNSAGGGIPLIHYSRTPSPSPYRGASDGRLSRMRSNTESSETADEGEEVPVSLRPLSHEGESGDEGSRGVWRRWTGTGNLGGFLFGTWAGWQVYVVLLAIWSFGWGFTVVLMNRFILWTGTYKFPYPLAHTWIQLCFTHVWLVLLASVARLLAKPLRKFGLSSWIAPSTPPPGTTHVQPPKGIYKLNPFSIIFNKAGGIAGGGLLDFDRGLALDIAPLAVVYVGKMVLSNISYAYAQLPLYTLSRIGTVPLTLVSTSVLSRTNHSILTLSSSLVLVSNLLIASIRSSERVIWESIVAGVFSSLFSALYPTLLLRTHKRIIGRLSSSSAGGDVFTSETLPAAQSREEPRAYWTLLHHLSTTSILLLTFLLLVSGEVPNIMHNCYFLDVPWFWFLTFLGGGANLAVFMSVLAFVRATSPLSSEVLKLPRQAAQMMILERFRLPVHAWVGVGMGHLSMGWYIWVRREEGRRWEMGRIGRARR